MFKFATPLVILSLGLINPVQAEIEYPNPTGASNAFSCDGKTLSSSAALILIDATDGLSPGQIEFVSDNFINTLTWESENDAISIVVLHDEPLQLMKKKTFCAPKPLSKANIIFDSMPKIRAQNRRFRRSLEEGFKEVIGYYATKGPAKSTLLIEATAEIYRNTRYSFKHAKKRELIIISDLYQSSKIINFFKVCKSGKAFASRPLTCPTFKTSTRDSPRFLNYVEKAAPRLTNSDSVTVYYLNVDGRVDRSAERWWREYFTEAGLLPNQLKIIPELQR